MRFICILLCLVAVSLAALVTPQERQVYDSMLHRCGFEPESVDFLKDWATYAQFKMPQVLKVLNHPWYFTHLARQTKDIAADSCAFNQNAWMWEQLCGYTAINAWQQHLAQYYSNNVTEPGDLFDYLDYTWQLANGYRNQAFAKLNNKQIQLLSYFGYSVFAEEQDSLKYQQFLAANGIEEPDSLSLKNDIVPLLKQVDLRQLAAASLVFNQGMQVLAGQVSKLNWGTKVKQKQTAFGLVALGSTKDDTYIGDYACIIDPAGNDTYRSRLQARPGQPFLWVLDASGNDLYESNDIAGLSFAMCGLAATVDLAGNDVYRSNDLAFAAMYGSQLHYDASGDDVYTGGLFAQAAAFFGVSLLHDASGNDIYSATQMGQGFGSTMGIGMLADLGGADLYLAGGKYLHAPLAPNDYRSMSQGFAFGLRPDLAGGIGILADAGGNDHYEGGVYAQGGGYWYALGMLLDTNGNDYYDAVYYPQGSGIHLAGGLLWDGDGDDSYFSKNGPGQGAGHDYGVGFFIDRAGNDYYSLPGGQGLGLTNSVGVFLDAAGDDRYERVWNGNLGYANQARGAGGLGLFLDKGGKDIYADSIAADSTFWTQGTWGAGLDTLLVVEEPKVEQMAVEEAAELDTLAAIKDIFAAACEWEVGSAAKRVRKARQVLINRQDEAAPYIYNKALDSQSGLVYRAISEFAHKATNFKPYIYKALEHSDSLVVKTGIALCGDVGDSTAVERLQQFLQQHKYEPSVLGALGGIKTDDAVKVLGGYCSNKNERLRVITARSLVAIGTTAAEELLAGMQDDPSFLIKSMLLLRKK